MPGQTGLDLLPELRSLPEAPPVIYVTGSEDSRVAVAALKAGLPAARALTVPLTAGPVTVGFAQVFFTSAVHDDADTEH